MFSNVILLFLLVKKIKNKKSQIVTFLIGKSVKIGENESYFAYLPYLQGVTVKPVQLKIRDL